MTFKEYINWQPKGIQINVYYDSNKKDNIRTEEDIKRYYAALRKELLNGKYIIQDNKQM